MLKISRIYLLVFISILLFGCGLPSYTVLDPPVPVIDTSQYRSLSFYTPNDDKIQGYIFYYKIYGDQEIDLIQSDKDEFEKNLDTENNSLDGKVLPLRLKYLPFGEKTVNTANDPQPLFEMVPETGIRITLDFTPVVSEAGSDPVLSIRNSSKTYLLRRGIVDNRLSSSDQNLLSFWDFDFPEDDSNSYYDQDLNDLHSRIPDSMPDYISIGICAISFGFSNDPGSGSFNSYSLPVFLGVIEFIPLEDSDRY